MSQFTLYIGNKAHSSWSLRGWLACKCAGISFSEVVIPLSRPETSAAIRKISPSGKVPVLRHATLLIWDSLAIGEYLAEITPLAGLWPEERDARAYARAISAEMHAGFTGLRRDMWMNVRRNFAGKGRTPEAVADIARVEEIWRATRARFGVDGPYLFGKKFTLADCMYAPVATRFVTWEPPLSAESKSYVAAIWDHPFLREWCKGADAEPWLVDKYENPR